MKKYRCTVCEWVYDPALCGVGKEDFELVD